MQDSFSELVERAQAIACPGRSVPLLPDATLCSAAAPSGPVGELSEPTVCLVLQGVKEVAVGAQSVRYEPGACFVGSVVLPVTSRIVTASSARPYMAISLALHHREIADLLAEVGTSAPEPSGGYAIGPAPAGLPEACLRLLALSRVPEDGPVMGPLIRKEILYRLLKGEQAGVLHQIVAADPKARQLRRTLSWMRDNLDQSVPIQDMANCAGMSEASFRRHFRATTGMSPLQYQKMLRLQEARRLLLAGTEVSRAAFAVGYESASQFSREYSRTFGHPPSREGRPGQQRPAELQAD
ncbi:AraC family transcriptional regulator [Pseudodonghicola flavimaris]|uniref:AraC family transcriptional regulator n=1 Tax=Pseudodonghicola flavimaris TaxID=3050036 RepID=A0ABT7F2W2_9RHOB|nr:AraC family transcriptional regulator [Pseudodonghicola flavimaris]MDK3018794.1 AraC family transcriptional regulator [Pseudodonghicola flavimaris]